MMNCKITKKEIKPFMSFGKMPLANGFLNKDDFKLEYFFNMEVGFSEDLSLFQLNDHPSPEKMFNEKYPFFTGSSEFMKNHFKTFSDWIKKNYLNSNSKLIEIGSNDGTLLKNFENSDINYIGFEPCKNIASQATNNNIPTLNKFFNMENLNYVNKYIKNTDVICASNVICHIPDLSNLIKTVNELLSKKGVFVFEEPYMGSMFEKVSYDQIYDEHIFLFSASSIKKIFNIFDFELINVLPQITHGGSMRYVLGRKGQHSIDHQVENILNNEKKNNLDNISSCLNFKKNCELSKDKITNLLLQYKKDGKKISGYAATSKSTTILNYCNIKNDVIDFICDTTPEKIGKFSPGTHIPIVDVSHFHKNLPDIAYLFAWNHKDEIFSKEKNFYAKGGKWISHVSI